MYIVLNADQGFWDALGDPFEIGLEVKIVMIAVEELLWHCFGRSFLDICFLGGMSVTKSLLFLLQRVPKKVPNHCKVLWP